MRLLLPVILWKRSSVLARAAVISIALLLLVATLVTFVYILRPPMAGLNQTKVEFLRRPTGPTCSFSSNEDPKLLEYIKQVHLTPPAPSNTPYNFNKSVAFNQEQPRPHRAFMKIVALFGPVAGGFFIEAGALDGQLRSHTLDLERYLGWKGLLVEALPSSFAQLKEKGRKAWLANVCLVANEPCKSVEFFRMKDQRSWNRGSSRSNLSLTAAATGQRTNPADFVSEGNVTCFPLASILKAIPVEKVDILVLDVEGGEYDVLKNFPFDKIPIRIIAVEHLWIPEGLPKLNLVSLLARNGYKIVFESIQDIVFVKVPFP